VVNEVFPDVVRGMTKFLARGYEGGERSPLRERFEEFCDKVGLINAALRK
jgi:hypothetical protein